MDYSTTSVAKRGGIRRTPIFIFVSYMAVFLLITITRGNLFFNLTHPQLFILLFVLSSLYLRLNSIKFKWDITLLYLIGLIILIINTSIYNSSFDGEFKRFILYGGLSFLLLGSLTFSEFKRIFLNVVVVLSILSLIIFVASFSGKLPLKHVENEYVSIGYYMYHAIEWNNNLLERNTGMFSEPGCFQYCLNYALFLHLEDVINKRVTKKTYYKLIVVIITLVTCASTTGYLVLMALLGYVFYKRRSRNVLILFFISIPLFLAALFLIVSSESVQGKFNQEEDMTSFVMRTADAIAMMEMIKDHPIVGNGGVGTKQYKKRIQNYGALTADHGASNGILVGMAVLGVSWLFMYCYFCYRGCKRIYKTVSPIVIVLLTLLVHTNEYFIFYPLVYVFIFPYRDSLNERREERHVPIKTF